MQQIAVAGEQHDPGHRPGEYTADSLSAPEGVGEDVDDSDQARCSEQNRRKTVTQSYGATADFRHARRAASASTIGSKLAAFPLYGGLAAGGFG